MMMKLSMKKIMAAAAIAAMAMSGAANAALAPFSSGAAGNSNLTFSAWDSNMGVGYTLDLGVALNDLFGADNATLGVNLATANSTVLAAALNNGFAYNGAMDGFNSFVAAAGSTANIKWNLVAAENDGRARVLTTQGAAATVADLAVAQKNENIASTAAAFNNYVTAVDAKAAGNHYANTVAADGTAYAGAASWNTLLGGQGLVSVNALMNGFSTNLYLLGQQSTEVPAVADLGTFSQAMTIDGRPLTVTLFLDENGAWDIKISAQVAAVPEADTYAMFLAGLGLVFFTVLRSRQD